MSGIQGDFATIRVAVGGERLNALNKEFVEIRKRQAREKEEMKKELLERMRNDLVENTRYTSYPKPFKKGYKINIANCGSFWR